MVRRSRRTCSYPAGVGGGKSAWNCTCMEEGNQTDVTSHAVNPGGCFDYADDDPLFKSIHGGEACMCKSLPTRSLRSVMPLRRGPAERRG